MSEKLLSSVKTPAPAGISPKMQVPPSDGTHFYTAGRMLSYFPVINKNGITFFREDCQRVLSTIKGSLADMQHIKPGYGVADPADLRNATVGSIIDYVEHDDGIDILCKNERDVAKSMGFNEEDFEPGSGAYSNFSQESDYNLLDSPWIVVDRTDPSKVVKEISYQKGLEMGLKRSHYNEVTGKWDYFYYEGNPVYVRLKPLAFSGVGHVYTPADASAQVYSYAASVEGERMIASFFPGMENTDTPMGSDPTSDHATTIMAHPDLLTTDVRDYSSIDAKKDDKPDSHFAAVWHDQSSSGEDVKRRDLPIKDDKGNLHRERLVAAYQSLSGMRGRTTVGSKLPPAVAAHAMALVRQGLDSTKPKQTKEISNMEHIEKELEDLKARAAVLASEKDTSGKELSATKTALEDLQKEFSDFKTTHDTLVAEYNKKIEDKDALLSEKDSELKVHADRALASVRLAELESVHPFSAEEKTEDFVKSLASVSDEGFETLKVRRELAKVMADPKKEGKELSSVNGGKDMSPAPKFEGLGKLSIASFQDLL